jgi:hypothetical protein
MGDLTDDERREFLSWLRDRYDEFRGEEEFIDEEAPHLLPAIRKVLGLKPKKRGKL